MWGCRAWWGNRNQPERDEQVVGADGSTFYSTAGKAWALHSSPRLSGFLTSWLGGLR